MIFFWFLLVGFLGGTIGASIKYVALEIPAVLLLTLRFGFSVILLAPFILKYKLKIPRNKTNLLFISSTLLTANILLYAIGVQRTSIIMAQLIYVPTSLIVASFGYVFLKEKLTKNQFIGLAITLLGMVILGVGSVKTRDIHSFGDPYGNLLIVVALFCWAFYLITSRKVVKDYSPLSTSFVNLSVAFALSVLLLPIEASNVHYNFSNVSLGTIVALSFLTIASTAFIFLYQKFIKSTSAFIASLVTYINPITAAFIGILVFDESLTFSLVLGGSIVFLGVFISTSFNYRKDKAKK